MNNKNTFTGDTLSHAIKNALSGVVCSLLFVLPAGNDSNLLIVFYVQIMPDDFVMQLHRF